MKMQDLSAAPPPTPRSPSTAAATIPGEPKVSQGADPAGLEQSPAGDRGGPLSPVAERWIHLSVSGAREVVVARSHFDRTLSIPASRLERPIVSRHRGHSSERTGLYAKDRPSIPG